MPCITSMNHLPFVRHHNTLNITSLFSPNTNWIQMHTYYPSSFLFFTSHVVYIGIYKVYNTPNTTIPYRYRMKLVYTLWLKKTKSYLCSTLIYPENLFFHLHLGKREEKLYAINRFIELSNTWVNVLSFISFIAWPKLNHIVRALIPYSQSNAFKYLHTKKQKQKQKLRWISTCPKFWHQ